MAFLLRHVFFCFSSFIFTIQGISGAVANKLKIYSLKTVRAKLSIVLIDKDQSVFINLLSWYRCLIMKILFVTFVNKTRLWL